MSLGPSSSLATLRPDLGGSMEEFDLAADQQGFIGGLVAPTIESAMKSGKFGKIPIEQLLQSRETERAAGTGYSRGKFKFEPASFACQEHGTEEPVDDQESEIYRQYFDAELFAALRARDIVLRNREIRLAALLFNTGTWTPTENTHEWDDASNAVPIANVDAAKKAVWDACGLWPNALIVNRKVFMNLRRVDEVVDKIKFVERALPGDILASHLRAAFDLKYIFVAGSAKNTANVEADASISPIWSDEYAMVARIAETGDLREPCVARTVHWAADGSTIGATVESYRDETIRGDVIRARMDVDELLLHTEGAHLLGNITT